VALGDFADVAVDGRFRLVYLVFNTFFALLTQPEQVRCFRNVAEHLTGDGVFVIETSWLNQLHKTYGKSSIYVRTRPALAGMSGDV
jgi:hypothetical protein